MTDKDDRKSTKMVILWCTLKVYPLPNLEKESQGLAPKKVKIGYRRTNLIKHCKKVQIACFCAGFSIQKS
jgi:hypothetical protein